MTQSFDARRWWLLVTKHWSENKKKYSLSLLAIGGLLLLWGMFLIFSGRHAPNWEVQVNSYYIGLYVVGCLYASLLFADLGSKTRGLNYLVVPASHAEKLACNLFYGIVVFFCCYTALYYVVDVLTVKTGNALAYSDWLSRHAAKETFNPQRVANLFGAGDHLDELTGYSIYLLLFYLVLQSAFIYGSLFFARFSFIKTVLSLMLIALLVSLVVSKLIEPILPPGTFKNNLAIFQVFTVKPSTEGNGVMIYSDPSTDKIVSLPTWIGQLLTLLLKFAFAPLLWLASFYRLKEKEI